MHEMALCESILGILEEQSRVQAYSRVGRHTTGSVLVLFNPMLARDRSHYAQFQHYHRYHPDQI